MCVIVDWLLSSINCIEIVDMMFKWKRNGGIHLPHGQTEEILAQFVLRSLVFQPFRKGGKFKKTADCNF